MYIKRLSIHGFKSFGKKTDFYFDKAITAIVGPNGSGKSNITEAIRFVLGEQSFKSIRTKDVTDLLFRGAESKANQLLVSLEFKEVKSLASKTDFQFLKNILEQDSIEISRTVYVDGKNLYKINNHEVRLKDVQEFLNIANLGAKTGWHISQGESDKILLASAEERKSIVEDALGLKIFHNKILDSEKKLEKSHANIREAQLRRREIAPELSALQKQIEKIDKVKAFKEDLIKKFSQYFLIKSKSIKHLKDAKNHHKKIEDLENSKSLLMQRISELQTRLNFSFSQNAEDIHKSKQQEMQILEVLQNKKIDLENKIRDIQSLFSYHKIDIQKSKQELENILQDIDKLQDVKKERLFKEEVVLSFKANLETEINKVNLTNLSLLSENVKKIFEAFIAESVLVSKDNLKEISYLKSLEERLNSKILKTQKELLEIEEKQNLFTPELEKVLLQIKITEENIKKLYESLTEKKLENALLEKDIETLKADFKEIENEIEKTHRYEFVLNEEISKLDQKHFELKRVFGVNFNILEYIDNFEAAVENISHESKNLVLDLERDIERLKIKIEEFEVENIDNVIASFKDLKEKDAFLLREISDLEISIKNLNELISELKMRLQNDFYAGVEAISAHFNEYVQKLFGGGSGKVFISSQVKKTKPEDTVSEENVEGSAGLEIEVELPKKKVKGLHSLSGGERALVSIALTVAVLHNNPAPFMILDEADATLDEANAHRYGNMLSLIKEKTKLIVVTHNRETMSFADEVYGITLEKNGASQVLSVSFDDALAYAK